MGNRDWSAEHLLWMATLQQAVGGVIQKDSSQQQGGGWHSCQSEREPPSPRIELLSADVDHLPHILLHSCPALGGCHGGLWLPDEADAYAVMNMTTHAYMLDCA